MRSSYVDFGARSCQSRPSSWRANSLAGCWLTISRKAGSAAASLKPKPMSSAMRAVTRSMGRRRAIDRCFERGHAYVYRATASRICSMSAASCRASVPVSCSRPRAAGGDRGDDASPRYVANARSRSGSRPARRSDADRSKMRRRRLVRRRAALARCAAAARWAHRAKRSDRSDPRGRPVARHRSNSSGRNPTEGTCSARASEMLAGVRHLAANGYRSAGRHRALVRTPGGELVKMGAGIVRHGRYVVLQLAEVAVGILRRIELLRPRPQGLRYIRNVTRRGHAR